MVHTLRTSTTMGVPWCQAPEVVSGCPHVYIAGALMSKQQVWPAVLSLCASTDVVLLIDNQLVNFMQMRLIDQCSGQQKKPVWIRAVNS